MRWRQAEGTRDEGWFLTRIMYDWRWSAQASGQLGVRWERNAPEIGYAGVLLDKLDGVGGNSLGRFQLSDDPRRSLATALVSQLHDGAHRKVTSELDGRSVLVETGGASGHGEGTLQAIFTGQSDRGVEGHPLAPALIADSTCRGHRGSMMRFGMRVRGVKAH